MISFLYLYTVIEHVLNDNIFEQITFIVDLGSQGVTGFLILVSITVCSSKIPEQMLDIKNTVGYIIEKYQLENVRDRKVLFFLKRVEQKVVYLTALGVVDFERSFLLSAFGVLFTYGILISNLR
ncbi:uncharacterized protein CDAR_2351 [Caerostris darwini]|uniref:Gustatory receptor n=1 Tax=Caerostris darwini TaxID=1538125 RepID=A0AAV4W8W3_9ARAC|nr:uncharacterized protein CDAR_2351 [Caerostris darwini]